MTPERGERSLVVVGAGIAGMTVAALAARAGFTVTLVDPRRPPLPPRGPIGLRTYALTPASRALLLDLDAWPRLDAGRLGPFTSMEVWDAGSSGRLGFAPPDSFRGPMGYIVEQNALAAALAATLAEERRVRWCAAALVELVPGTPPRLVLDDGTEVAPQLVVGADGQHSRVRATAGIDWQSHAYGQAALCCNITTALPHRRVARQRFLPGGPLALLPLAAPDACSVVWSLPEEDAAAWLAADDASLAAALAEASAEVLGDITSIGERGSFALVRASAASYLAEGVVLVGDAAHVVHPLAGQGLNLGLMDAAALVECLEAQGAREPWPLPLALRRYQRWRRSEALAMTVVTDGLNRLFRTDAAPLALLRGLGLGWTDRARPLKRWLAEHAMGIAGDLPRRLDPRRARR